MKKSILFLAIGLFIPSINAIELDQEIGIRPGDPIPDVDVTLCGSPKPPNCPKKKTEIGDEIMTDVDSSLSFNKGDLINKIVIREEGTNFNKGDLINKIVIREEGTNIASFGDPIPDVDVRLCPKFGKCKVKLPTGGTSIIPLDGPSIFGGSDNDFSGPTISGPVFSSISRIGNVSIIDLD